MHSKFFLGLSLLFFTKGTLWRNTQYMQCYLKNSQLLIHYRNTQKIIYQFVNKDNGQNPNIDTFSYTPLGILENLTLTMNSTKDTLSNRSSRTESKYRNQNNIPVG